ncbi:MAG: MMPL family transporter [Phycisphaerales bacterium]
MANAQPGHDRPFWIDRLTRFVLAYPRSVIAFSVVTAFLGALLGWFRLPLDANTDSLISRDRPWMKQYLAFLREFGDLEYLYVVVDTKGHRDDGERAVDALLPKLRALGDLPGVHGRIEPDEMWRLTSRAADDESLRGLSDAAQGLATLAAGGDWLTAAEAMQRQLASSALAGTDEGSQRRLGASFVLTLDAIASVGEAARGERPGLELAAPRRPEYLASDTGRLLFIGLLPRKDFSTLTAIEGPLDRIRAVIRETQSQFPNVDIGLTGKPVLQADELLTSTGDTTISFAVGLALVAGLCVVIYRDWRRPLLSVIAFGVAIGWTQGAASLLVGHLTLLSMVFLLVLIGAGLDYGIHVVSRYTEYRRTESVSDSVKHTMHSAAPGTLTGAATSAAVFALAIFSNFQGLRELGIIAGAGLVLCALAMVTTLPALLVLFDTATRPKPIHDIPMPWASVATDVRTARRAIRVFGVLTVLSLVAIPFGFRFESNLLKLQSQDLESVAWERRVLADSASLSWFGALPVSSEREALAAIARAKSEPEIGTVRSVFDLVRPSTDERDAWRTRLAASNGPRSAEAGATTPWSAGRLRALASQVRTMATLAIGRATREEIDRLKSLAARIDAFAQSASDPDPQATARRDEARTTIASAAASILDGASASLRDALPAAVRDRFVSPDGKLLVHMIPRNDTWEYEPLKSFVRAIRRVDPNSTGVPITQSESIGDMIRAFVSISLWSVVAVALIAWLDFRSVHAVILCTGVLLVGIVLTLGLLAVLRVPLSLANFFGIPILIGLGIDSNIHLLHRANETYRRPDAGGSAQVEFGATRGAVIFTALTTAIGFGGQVFASHKGMQDLGWIMVIGSLVCLATSVWLLPALLRTELGAGRRGASEPASEPQMSLASVAESSASSTPSGSASRNARP